MSMTTPTPGQPLSEADVSLLQPGDQIVSRTGKAGTFLAAQHGRIAVEIKSTVLNGCTITDAYFPDYWSFVSRPHAPVSRPAGEGETTQHTPRCWGRTSYSDEMAHCYCKPAGEGEREAVAILKGIGKIDGDGWKDTTTKGEVVYVWNAEKPSPYAPGQYPRIGNEGWSASTSQYDFTPATADDVPAILALLRPAAPDAGGGEDLAGKLKAIRDKFLFPTPDKDHTDYAVMTRCIAALQPGGER